MVGFDYRGFWFTAKFLIVFFLAVFLAKNIPYLFFKTDLGVDIDNQIKPTVLTASVVKVENKPIRLAFVGDIMLARNVRDVIEAAGGGDYGFPFAQIKEKLKDFDLLFANLEGSISDRGDNLGSTYSFRMSPKAADALRNAGFDVLSVANNHIGDWGARAIYDTIFNLRRVGLAYIGAGLTEEEAFGAKFLEAKNTTFAFLAFTDVPSLYTEKNDEVFVASTNPEEIQKQVKKARSAADIIIVSFHFGTEYAREPNEVQRRLAYLAIESGADLVIGHHPHVTQPIEKYKDSYIAYSLGNFVFDQNFSEETMGGLMLEVEVENKKIVKVTPKSIKLNPNFQPSLIDE